MKLIIDKDKIAEKAKFFREGDDPQPYMYIKVGDLFLDGIEINDGDLLSTLLQSVMTTEQINQVFQEMVNRTQRSWRDQIKEKFRITAEIGGDMFYLAEIEKIIDSEVIE